jgi:hypothetical protein
MFSIASIFGGAKTAPAPVPSPAQVANQPNPTNNPAQNTPAVSVAAPTTGTAPNGVIPNNTNDGNVPNPEAKAPVSPLDNFAKVWEPTPVDPNKPQPTPSLPSPEDYMKAATQIDFTKVIDQETMAKINAGGEGAMQAVIAAMGKMQQQSFGQGLAATQKIVERALKEKETQLATAIPNTVKAANVREQLFEKNAALRHPAVAPMVEVVRSQLQEKYPQASEAQLLEHAQQMILGMGQAFAPAPAPEVKTVPKDQDWSDL